MSNFRLGRLVDAAYCTVNTFRHLLTEQAARDHLECVAGSLRSGGIYLLGLHLLPLDTDPADDARWTGVARRDKSDRNAAHAAHRSPPPDREPSGLPAGAPRVEGTSPAARISAPHIYGKAISTATRFGSVAGTVQHLRFPVRH